MIGNVDLDLLEKTYQNASSGVTAINSVLDKVSGISLQEALNRQKANYLELMERSKEQLNANGAKAKDKSIYDKVMMKGNVKLNMLKDSTDSHIADMVIKGSAMGITQMTKLVKASENADGTSKEIANDFIKKEQQNIEIMKKYL